MSEAVNIQKHWILEWRFGFIKPGPYLAMTRRARSPIRTETIKINPLSNESPISPGLFFCGVQN